MNAAAASRKRKRPFGKHVWLSVLGGLVMALAMTGGVDAYWAATGTGSGSGPVGTLAASLLNGSPGAGTATLIWTEVAPPGSGPVSYYVQRVGGSLAGNCPTQASPTSVLTCTDSGLSAGTYNYTVTVVAQSWTSTSSLAPVTLASGALDHFVLSAATTTPTAGQADNLTITAKDAAGNTVTGYTGTGKCIAFTGPANSPNGNAPVYPVPSGCAAGQSAVSFSSGVAATVPVTLYNASTSTVITATDAASGKSGSSAALTVSAVAAARYSLTDTSGIPLGAQTAGTPFSVKLTALDSYGNVASGYFGTKTIAWSGPGTVPGYPPIYPAGATSVTFTSGVGTATGITLYKGETLTLQAQDSNATTIKGTAIFTVNPLAVSSLSLAATTTTPTAGQADNLTITALDTYGNTATSYTGSHSLTFSGATANGSFIPNVTNSSGIATNFGAATAITFTNGIATVSGSANGVMKLYTVETAHIVVSDGSHTNGTGLAVTVSAATLDSFTITTPPTQTAGAAFSVSLTAKDAYGNTVTGYTGIGKCIAFTGPANSPNGKPPLYPNQGSCLTGQSSINFTNGVAATVPVTLYNASTSTVITATDAASGKSGSSAAFTVNAAAAASYSLTDTSGSPLGAQTAGTPFSVKLTALDSYGNVASGYFGTKTIAWSGPGTVPGYPPIYPAGATSVTFASGVGTATGITLYKAETPTLQALDSSAPAIKGTASFNVNPLAISSLRLTAATTTPNAGEADNLTITALDQYGNTATSYTGLHSLTFSGPTAIGTFTPNVTNSGGIATNFGAATAITFTNGIATVSGSANGVMKLYRVQSVNIVVSDGSHTNGTGLAVTVSAGPPSSFTIPNPGTRTAGTAFNVTLTATADAYGNSAASYTGTHCIVFSGPTASPNGTAPLYPAKGSCGAGQSAVTFAAGVGTANITLYDATTSTTLTATDAVGGTTGTTAAFAVNGLTTMSTFVLTAADAAPTAGQNDALTITAGDTWGNLVTGYTGAHNLTFSGAGSIGTYNPTVTNNVGTATRFGTVTAITFTNGVSSAGGVMTLYRAQTAHLVVSDGSHQGSLDVTVSPAALNTLSLAAEKVVVRPGTTDNLTIRAVDAYGNAASGYTDGPHNLTFSGGTGVRTVTNSSGAQVNFGTPTAITFTNGISTAGGVMRISDVQTANVTASDGVLTSPALRIVVSNVSATAVSAGGFHNCAIVAGGVECWGYNNYGQLGNGTTIDSSTPVRVVGVGGSGYLSNVTQISAGKYHTCAVVSGAVYCWGQNVYAQLGNNSTNDSSTPVQVHTGTNTYLANITQVGSGGGHSCALRSTDNTVWCWGRNAFGEVGDNTTNQQRQMAVQVHISTYTNLTNAVEIAIGTNHSCARLSDGTARCWGYNLYGEVGDNTTTNRSVATLVVGASSSGTLGGITDLSSGRFHTCALISDSTVYCWGYNNHGQLGDGTIANRSLPVRAGSITTATTVSAGEYHSCAALADGTAQCWGAAAFGQVGDGTTADTSTPVTVIGPGGYGVLTGVAVISAGGGNWPDGNGTLNYEHTIALLSDGTVVSWGQNIFGQLGDGTTTMSISPVGVALQ